MIVGALFTGLAAVAVTNANTLRDVIVPRAVDNSSSSYPSQAQFIDPKSFASLPTVQPETVFNYSTIFVPPNSTIDSLKAKPFHVYHPDFLSIIGSNPKLTLLAENDSYSFAHEAVIYHEPTGKVFFAVNAGGALSYTGVNATNKVSSIYLADADAAAASGNGSYIPITEVPISPPLEMANGGTNFRDQLLYTNEGRGANITANLALVNPYPPYNSTVILNNFFGRQFNSLNDVVIHPVTKEIYFTDTTYGYTQNFRPAPGLPQQAYRFNYDTGAVRVVADGFGCDNGITFSPDGKTAYVTDTGLNYLTFDPTKPSSIYKYDVDANGNFVNRSIFTYCATGVPDGVHVDSNGNVYTGVGDGLNVYNPAGVLLGKIFLGTTSANFKFVKGGGIIICAETKLFYASGLAAIGPPIVQ